jgi:putative transposase
MLAEFDNDETLRAWLSVMLSGYSRKVLAFVLDYNAPSNKTCMLLIRECVRLHRRLPRTLAMDGGKEFRSTYFRSLMAMCRITAEYRPPRRPRFGAQIERWFKTANDQLFHQLLGNTKVMRNVRQVTQAVNPSNLAVWTLETLHETVSEFCYEFYNENRHSSLGCSPNQKYTAGLKEHGLREDRRFEYTPDFIIWTLPSTPKGVATVSPNGTISVFNFDYYAPGMVPGTKLQTRYDPCDISHVYVYLNKRWVWAKCGLHQQIAGMSEKQRELASKALRAEQKDKGQAQDASERNMGKFLGTNAAKEVLLMQRKKDAALARIMKSKTLPVPKDGSEDTTPPVSAPGVTVELPPRKKIPVYRASGGER